MENKIKLFLHNLFNRHRWKLIGETKPIKHKDEFDNNCTMMALGECEICGQKKLRRVLGNFKYYASEILTISEYIKKYDTKYEIQKWK